MTCDPCEITFPQFLQGTELNLIATYTDAIGNLIDPTIAILNIKPPTGPVQTFTPNRISQGIYSYPFIFSIIGTYGIQFEGNGNIVAIEETQVIIYASIFS